jgi:ATP-dependent DNA ligase
MASMSLEFIKPQLATSVDHPPPRAGWIHEVKHDGYRTILIIERRKAHAERFRLDRRLSRHNKGNGHA